MRRRRRIIPVSPEVSDIPEATTQPASFIPTWEDPSDRTQNRVPVEILNALEFDLTRDDSDPPLFESRRRSQSTIAGPGLKVEPTQWESDAEFSIGTMPPEFDSESRGQYGDGVEDRQVLSLPRLRIMGTGVAPSGPPVSVPTIDE